MPEIMLTEEHVYHVDGIERPGVNQILTDTGLVKPYNGDPWYGKRGTYTHTACHMLDMGDLDEETLDPAIKGYVEAYKKFKAESGMVFLHSEEKLWHPQFNYCGTPDRFYPVLDIKTGDMHEPLTLELYAEIIRVNRQDMKDKTDYELFRTAYFLRLKEDGTYNLKPYKLDATNKTIALSAVNVWHERRRRGTL